MHAVTAIAPLRALCAPTAPTPPSASRAARTTPSGVAPRTAGRPPLRRRAGVVLALALVALAAPLGACAQAAAASPLSDALRSEIERMAQAAATTVWGAHTPPPRTEVIVGALNPSLKLAPCQQVQPYLPPGIRPLGRSRIGLRCIEGPTHWNVSLPVTIKLWAPSLVASGLLPAGTVLTQAHLRSAEVDLAERPDPAITEVQLALGRTLQRSLAAGDALRRGDLKTRQFFSGGDTVRIVAQGPGYAISSEGQALGPGLEGQSVRVRIDNGRVLSGIATGHRRIELAL